MIALPISWRNRYGGLKCSEGTSLMLLVADLGGSRRRSKRQ